MTILNKNICYEKDEFRADETFMFCIKQFV